MDAHGGGVPGGADYHAAPRARALLQLPSLFPRRFGLDTRGQISPIHSSPHVLATPAPAPLFDDTANFVLTNPLVI